MKVAQVIKYILIVADLAGMAGLFYSGINTFLNFNTAGDCTNVNIGSYTYSANCPNSNCTLGTGSVSLSGTSGSISYTLNLNCNNQDCTGTINLNEASGSYTFDINSFSCANQMCTVTISPNAVCSAITHASVQDVVWAIYYMIFAVIITLSLFPLPFVQKSFNFLYGYIGRGIFIAFWGTLLLAKSVNFVVGIGIYLIILGALHVTYGIYTWGKKPAPSSQDKYETGVNQPADQQNNAAASDNAQKAQQESAKKKKAKETTNNEEQEPPQDNQVADNNISLSAKKKGAKTRKGYELEEEEA